MSYFSEEEINEIRERLELASNTTFNWEDAKENLIETECGITLCRDDYFERDKERFTFNETLEIEKEAKKHGLRLPTVKDLAKLYAFYGVDDDGEYTPRRFIEELGFSYAGFYLDGRLFDADMVGSYWSSTTYSAGFGCNLHFDRGGVNFQDESRGDYGFAVKFIYDPEGKPGVIGE